MASDDSSVKKSSGHGGKREGAGRKRGQLNQATKDRAVALQQYRERVVAVTDRLFNAQFALAEGITLLFRVDKDAKGNDLPAQQVTDADEIKAYIDGNTDSDAYYFITTKAPDNKAIDSMFDRTYGKAEAKLDLTSKGRRIESPAVISTIIARHAAEPEAEATAGD